MRFRMAVTFATFFLFCFAIAVWTSPASALPTAPDAQSAIGRISSVGDTAFSLDVAKTDNSGNPNTLQFVIESTTRVQGRLAVGASATVDYHNDGGKLIAIVVVVMPSGV